MRSARLAIAFAFVAMIAILVSCKEPTQILVEARTNVEFKAGIVTSFTVGGPGQTEKAEPTTETSEPWQGSFIGSLVVVPGTADDAVLAVKLVMGVARSARDCVPPDYRGCIVARRRVRYVPHEMLRLPITLYTQCQDVPCDEISTCSALGQCVPVEPACVDGTCVLPGEQDGTGVDGGAIDGARSDATEDASDAAVDGNVVDAADSGDATFPTGPGTIACGDGPCTVGSQICCFNAATNMGSCTPSGVSCGAGNGEFRFECDSKSDCTGNDVCCIGPTGGSCVPSCPYSQPCQSGDDAECPSPQKCTGSFAPYYRLCQFP